MQNLVFYKDQSFSLLEDITNNKITASSSSLKMINHMWFSYNNPYCKNHYILEHFSVALIFFPNTFSLCDFSLPLLSFLQSLISAS